MTEIVYGITIKGRLSFKNIKIVFGENEVIILPTLEKEKFAFINFYTCLIHFFKKNHKIKTIFGLFSNGYLSFTRIKLKDDFIEKLNHETLISLLEHNNLEAYYGEDRWGGEFYGIEIRYEGEFCISWDYEKEYKSLLLEARVEKEKIFNYNV